MNTSNLQKKENRLKIALIINLIIFLMEVVGAIMSFHNHGVSMFQFYTEDSNLFAMVACGIYSIYAVTALKNKEFLIPKWVKLIKYMAASCLSVTFVVVLFILAPPGGLKGFQMMLFHSSMLFHHLLCPLLAIISFIFFETEFHVERKYIFLVLIPTLCYAVITMFLNLTKVMYGPYPFLHVYEQPLYMSCIWFVLIHGIAFLLALCLRKLNSKLILE